MKILFNFYIALCFLIIMAVLSVSIPEMITSKDNFSTGIGTLLMIVISSPLLYSGWASINEKIK